MIFGQRGTESHFSTNATQRVPKISRAWSNFRECARRPKPPFTEDRWWDERHSTSWITSQSVAANKSSATLNKREGLPGVLHLISPRDHFYKKRKHFSTVSTSQKTTLDETSKQTSAHCTEVFSDSIEKRKEHDNCYIPTHTLDGTKINTSTYSSNWQMHMPKPGTRYHTAELSVI